ncbi:MAG: hypothetical protein GX458_16880 [Phyllobacteriaceae bacterium]|nr:hypothetical protein [Phyllobacteriaceae bacterium]
MTIHHTHRHLQRYERGAIEERFEPLAARWTTWRSWLLSTAIQEPETKRSSFIDFADPVSDDDGAFDLADGLPSDDVADPVPRIEDLEYEDFEQDFCADAIDYLPEVAGVLVTADTLFEQIFSGPVIGEVRRIRAADIGWIGQMMKAAVEEECAQLIAHFEAISWAGPRPIDLFELVTVLDNAMLDEDFHGFPIHASLVSTMRGILDGYELAVGEGGEMEFPSYDVAKAGAVRRREAVRIAVEAGYGPVIMRFADGSRLHLVGQDHVGERDLARDLSIALGRPFASDLRASTDRFVFALSDHGGRLRAVFVHPSSEGLEILPARSCPFELWCDQADNLRAAMAVLRNRAETDDAEHLRALLVSGVPDGAYDVETFQGGWEEGVVVAFVGSASFRDGVISDYGEQVGFVGVETFTAGTDIWEETPVSRHFTHGLSSGLKRSGPITP